MTFYTLLSQGSNCETALVKETVNNMELAYLDANQ